MDQLKHILDGASILAAIVTIAGWITSALPPLAALASILWICFQFYHSAPMKARRDRKEKNLEP
jgi:hypothetical protein